MSDGSIDSITNTYLSGDSKMKILMKDILLNNSEEDENINLFIDYLKKAFSNESLKNKFKESMSTKNEDGMDNFMYLCKRGKGSEKFASYLIDIDSVVLTNIDNEGFSCLIWAIFSKSEKLIYKIIDKEPSLLEIGCKQKITPIVYATRQKMFNIVYYMLQKNNNLFNHIDHFNSTPFVYLIDKTHFFSDDILEHVENYLKEHKIKIDMSQKPEQIVKTIKCELNLNHNHSDLFNILNYIFENNIEIRINQPNKNGDTALIFAVFVMNEELAIKLFEKYGVNCNFSNKNVTGESAFSFAVRYKLFNFVSLLLDSEFDDVGQHVCLNNSKTPLLELIDSNRDNLVLKLLNKPITNLEICNENGDTALTLAIKKNMKDVVHKLLDIGCDIDYSIDNNDESPLMLACKNNWTDTVIKMFELKDDLYIIENENFKNSAIYWMTKNKMIDVAKIIFEKIDKILFFKYEDDWKKLLKELRSEKRDENTNFFIQQIVCELVKFEKIKQKIRDDERQLAALQQEKLLKEIEEEEKKEKELKLKKQMKKKAQKEKIKLRKVEKNKNRLTPTNELNGLNDSTDSHDLKPSNIDSIQIIQSNKDSNLEINIDLVESPNTFQVHSPSFENSNLNQSNDISTFLNTKHQVENWYFELEKIKF
jgi:ankyrin repeat protein